MKLHKYIIGLALLVSSSSCNFLDEEAYEFITPDNFYKTEDRKSVCRERV